MNDLISRSALLDDIEETVRFSVRSGVPSAEMRGANKVVSRIEVAPAVDAVPVVRCKDCYYFRMYHCKHPQWEYPQGFPMVSEYDFCAYGERRNGDD